MDKSENNRRFAQNEQRWSILDSWRLVLARSTPAGRWNPGYSTRGEGQESAQSTILSAFALGYRARLIKGAKVTILEVIRAREEESSTFGLPPRESSSGLYMAHSDRPLSD